MSLNHVEWRWIDVRRRSRALFGSPHRLAVVLLASIADDDELYAARIAGRAGIDRQEAVRELRRLVAADLLVETDRVRTGERGRPARFLERRDLPTWQALQALGDPYRSGPQK
jgi:hypothetical protein